MDENTNINDQKSPIKKGADISKLLTFLVGGEKYGIDLMTIIEIKRWSETTSIPNSPEFMRGVINLRGLVVPVFDLKLKFNMGEIQPNEKNVIIIISIENQLIGILVDGVSDIIDASGQQLKSAPQIDSKIDTNFIKGLVQHNNEMIVVLEASNLLGIENLESFSKLAEGLKNENK